MRQLHRLQAVMPRRLRRRRPWQWRRWPGWHRHRLGRRVAASAGATAASNVSLKDIFSHRRT